MAGGWRADRAAWVIAFVKRSQSSPQILLEVILEQILFAFEMTTEPAEREAQIGGINSPTAASLPLLRIGGPLRGRFAHRLLFVFGAVPRTASED